MMNPHDFSMSPQAMNLGSHMAINPLTVMRNSAWMYRQEQRQQSPEKGPW
jgi:hypothetical protein